MTEIKISHRDLERLLSKIHAQGVNYVLRKKRIEFSSGFVINKNKKISGGYNVSCSN
jgi:hypothetical protein